MCVCVRERECGPIRASDPSPAPDPMNRRRFRTQSMDEAGGILRCEASWLSPSMDPLYIVWVTTRVDLVELSVPPRKWTTSNITLEPGALLGRRVQKTKTVKSPPICDPFYRLTNRVVLQIWGSRKLHGAPFIFV